MESAATEALSSDIHLLGDLLGGAIRRLEGEAAFQLVEEIRAAAKDVRASPSLEKARELHDRLGRLTLPELRTLIRAFSIYFDLTNLAEQQARVRAIRSHLKRSGTSPMNESPEAALRQLSDRGIVADEVAAHLQRALICPVFTAHPSEGRRRTSLGKLAAIADQLDVIEHKNLIPAEREQAVSAIAEEVETLWLSDTIRENRPSVLDEVRQTLGLVEQTLLQVVPKVYRNIERGLKRVYPEHKWEITPFLRFGSWIGGDRDGHPGVSAQATKDAVRLQQETLLRHYIGMLDELWRRLSNSDRFASVSQELRDSIARDLLIFPQAKSPIEHEPYRTKCRIITAKLQRTLEFVKSLSPAWDDLDHATPTGVYLGREELLADLKMMAKSLHEAGAEAAASGALHDVILQAEVFGLHLFTLDLRQHSARHTEAIDEVLRAAGVCPAYATLDADERFACLAAELESDRPLIPTRLDFSPETVEVIKTFRAVASILEQQSPEAINTYIISSTTQPAHLLEVLLLAREARLFRPKEGISRLNIVPLFEALEPLVTSSAIMEQLLAVPAYRRHVALRDDCQEVMIGYSDSNKESGALQSAWALYRAQVDLVATGRKYGLTMQMFHGRGGAIGRGGGPANHAILAQPNGTVNGRLRITEQGEVITDRYGHAGIAERHLEQLVHAVLHTSFPEMVDEPDPAWVKILDEMAPTACTFYRSLVYDTPEFIAYFRQATPIEELGHFKIGSRPTRRTTSSALDSLRAIPWVFSWMQCRHTLPGWLGLGSALTQFLAANPDQLTTLRTMYLRWPFWRTLIDNAQMILSKADMTIARLYADLVDDRQLADQIYGEIAGEYKRAVDVILQITEQTSLLQNMPILQRSIALRNPYVDPLSFIQLVLLKRLRSGESPREDLLTGVLESINGVAAGLKNTG